MSSASAWVACFANIPALNESHSSVLINDAGRAPVVAQRREGEGLLLHARGVLIALSKAEVTRLIQFLYDGETPQSTTPAKARWSDDQ